MEPSHYQCPWCHWHGPKAKEERYTIIQGGKLMDGFRYICPHCRMDVFSPHEQPQLKPPPPPARSAPRWTPADPPPGR